MIISDFCEKYEVGQSCVFNLKSKKKVPDNIFYKKNNEKVMRVNAEYFIKRREFKKFVKLFNQDTYYYLEEFFTDTEIAMSVSKKYNLNMTSFRMYLSNGLFTINEKSILSYVVNNYEWNFFRYGRQIRQTLKRRNKKFDIQKILDRRAGLAS